VAKRATRAEWLERVRAWKASGKTRAEFALTGDYSERSLGWWAWKLGSEGEVLKPKQPSPKQSRRKKPRPLELVEVVSLSEPSPSPMTMRVGAVEVLVSRGFDRELLGSVLEVLEARR
jgi:hypothetical protein